MNEPEESYCSKCGAPLDRTSPLARLDDMHVEIARLQSWKGEIDYQISVLRERLGANGD